ncbi:type II restriction endonuclease [Govanella unica]|uniref:Type II restriction endonuclease n=1 Tax=Govanella unica TaxID=2975056 RepID=A0A9X3Z658_9PROT|nr:type II restriction endonuclease [Govania unica]MDA5192796.1 type II restriction endonuclease [Govania unica]
MKRGQLSDYFEGVVVKRLSAVETTPAKSNQHEFNGSTPLRQLLGDEDRRNIPTRFVWLGGEQEALSVEGTVSWYDARRMHPVRTEYRLYYPGNEVTGMMQAGDVFFLALCRDGTTMVIITPVDSTIQNQLLWLFGLEEQPEFSFAFQEIEGTHNADLDFAARYILDELGIEPEEPEAGTLDDLIERFGLVFPKTRDFSELARSSLPEISALDDPDRALIEWMDREEQLFRRLERRVVAERISAGFHSPEGADVDGFLSFSLSVQNRRKSRAGQALENHLEAVFTAHGISYARGAETENRNKPDFLFPGQAEYRDPSFPAARLTMLGAKSTLKDRWRQVLSEAQRIDDKHLLTLEPGISENQTSEMQSKRLQLVVPRRLHGTYRSSQQVWLMDLGGFLSVIRDRQG